MGRIHFHAAPLFLMSFAALAQTQALPSFEVASVKPAAPQVADMSPAIPASGEQVIGMRVMLTGPRGGPGGSDPGRITYLGMSMKSLLLTAYGVKPYQLSGPSWMETERFDIVAKIPEGASKDDTRLMLQNLLAERFKLTLHRDKKEMTMWALAVGKNGLKMKASPDLSHPRIVTTTMPGHTRITFTAQSLEQLAKELGNNLERPVVDMTGLADNYDFTLEYAPESTRAGGPAAEPDAAPSLFTALQEQLGLKLEQSKAQIEVLVVDRVEKTPTEN